MAWGALACSNGVGVTDPTLGGAELGEGPTSVSQTSAASFEPTTEPSTSSMDDASSQSASGPTTDDATLSDTSNGPSTDPSATVSTDPSDSDSDSNSDTNETGPGPGCGNGDVDGDEACDAGGQTAECDADCTFAECGDGYLNDAANEQCDEGGQSVGCDADCTSVQCGDGVANGAAGESCDDGGPSQACDGDCTFAECGDGVINDAAGEICDDGDLEDGDGCDATCTFELLDCRFVNGLNWCRNPGVCGQACNDVCAVEGLAPVGDDATWSAAQDSIDECTALVNAFGFAADVSVGGYTYACAEIPTSADGTPTTPMYCSDVAQCPTDHRTNADGLGVPCGGASPFQSICPCA